MYLHILQISLRVLETPDGRSGSGINRPNPLFTTTSQTPFPYISLPHHHHCTIASSFHPLHDLKTSLLPPSATTSFPYRKLMCHFASLAAVIQAHNSNFKIKCWPPLFTVHTNLLVNSFRLEFIMWVPVFTPSSRQSRCWPNEPSNTCDKDTIITYILI